MQDHEFVEEQQDLLDLNEIMQAFGMSEWTNLGPVVSPQNRFFSVLVEIQGERYLLRERLPGLAGEEDDDHRYRFQRFLQQTGIPIPPLWLTPQGEAFVKIGEDQFELQQWANGELFSTTDRRSLEWVAAAASMLGQLHQASRRYSGLIHRWPTEVQAGGLVQGWLNLARSKAEQTEIQAVAAALSNWVDHWEAALPAAMMAIGATRGLPEFHIHGDYHALNLRFDSQSHGVNAVLGLEASRWEKRILELAYSLFYFSALEWQADSTFTHPLVKRGFEPERAHRFLQAYGAVYPPVPGEAAVLVDALMLVAPIATVNGPLEDIFFAQEGVEEPLIDDVMERLAWASSLLGWLGRVRRSLAEMWA
ncbi:MAG TPA: phosphotransferase [Ktedonobacteraceae bacterium]|nr:phosphotransferase [Ktedonobacteraceae bacterium]